MRFSGRPDNKTLTYCAGKANVLLISADAGKTEEEGHSTEGPDQHGVFAPQLCAGKVSSKKSTRNATYCSQCRVPICLVR